MGHHFIQYTGGPPLVRSPLIRFPLVRNWSAFGQTKMETIDLCNFSVTWCYLGYPWFFDELFDNFFWRNFLTNFLTKFLMKFLRSFFKFSQFFINLNWLIVSQIIYILNLSWQASRNLFKNKIINLRHFYICQLGINEKLWRTIKYI